jgi:hypothetical protein
MGSMAIIDKKEGERRVQSLIKGRLDELENIGELTALSPDIYNTVRHMIIRIAFGSYAIGLISR